MATAAPERSGRAEEVRAKLAAAATHDALDAVVAMSPENVTYVAGASPPSQRTVRSRLAACVVPVNGTTELIAVSVDAGVVRERAEVDEVTAYEEFVDDPVAVVARSLVERGLPDGRIGIETSYLPVDAFARLEQALPNAKLVSADALFSSARAVKTETEIAQIRAIGAAAETIARESVTSVRAGDTERDLGRLIEDRYAEAGGDRLEMLVVGSGARSAHPNAPPTAKRLAEGDVVRIDVIGTAAGYYSDVARTAVVGEPTDEHASVYRTLLDIHERTLAQLRPGARCSEIFAIYAEAMKVAGLPAYHFVGHGLGITLHEDPFLNDTASTELEKGMVLCIEPLTMIDGRFGMQIEDEVLITADGFEPLTRADDLLRIEA